MCIMKDDSAEHAEWHAVIVTLIILGAMLGAEQVMPISDTLRSQIGVLTVMLGFGLWHVAIGIVKSRMH